MPRRPRIELAGGLYHIIARGNERRDIFHSKEDFQKFLALLSARKQRLPFFLYAYCLMTNHFHLLIERREDSIGRIMHRVLTGYSQYYNRKYRRSGHLFQGRHKSILCQSDRYLCELVRYIHLNPVRANIVRKPERYPQSSHRAYLGLEAADLVDVDPVLRHFGSRKKAAREHYVSYIAAGKKLGYQDEFYITDEAGILGSEEFVDETIDRLGDTGGRIIRRRLARAEFRTADGSNPFRAEDLIAAIERKLGIKRELFVEGNKSATAVNAREIFTSRAARSVPARERYQMRSVSTHRTSAAAMKQLAKRTMLR